MGREVNTFKRMYGKDVIHQSDQHDGSCENHESEVPSEVVFRKWLHNRKNKHNPMCPCGCERYRPHDNILNLIGSVGGNNAHGSIYDHERESTILEIVMREGREKFCFWVYI